MGLQLFSFPQVVFKQATAPDGVSGRLWLDTDTNELFYYNGTSWVELSVDVGFLGTEVLQNSLDIVEIQAADTLTGGQSAGMVRDIFSDSTGFLNTIATGSTTATFVTDTYHNLGVSVADSYPNALTNAYDPRTSPQVSGGIKFLTKAAVSLKSITKHSHVNSAKAQLLDASLNVLATATFSGDVATFTTPYQLANATSYYAVVYNDGSDWNDQYVGSQTFPYTAGTYVDFTAGYLTGGDESAFAHAVVSLQFYNVPANKIVQTDMQTLGSTPTSFQIFAWKDSTSGTGSVTGDVSFNNGTNYQTGIALDTATTITNTGDEMILKLNLNAGASNGAASAKGYGVLFW